MTYNHISLSQKEPDKWKMINNDSDINVLWETIIHVGLESAHVTSEHFSCSFSPSNLASGAPVMMALQ